MIFMKRLENKVALVTGAGRGIGRAISLALAKEGCNIVAVARTKNEIEETAAEVKRLGRQALAIRCDVSNAKDVQNAVSAAEKRFSSIDILVNNAGVAVLKELHEMSEKEWDYILDVNLKGTFLFCKRVAPLMKKRKSGTIVNISSGLGKRGYARASAYSASKFAVIGLTESLAMELKGEGIKVFAVCPGGVDTNMYRDLWGTSFGTMKPEYIAKRVVELCLPENKEKSGASIEVYGYLSALLLAAMNIGKLRV